MDLGSMLSTLLIGPLKLIFEVIFSLVNRLDNPGLSIVALSLCMNLLVLPLYRRADAIQDEAREAEERLAPGIRHIRSVFHGDQRFMILQTYYRQNHYSPMHALRGALPLLLEIPFFIAAYQFLSTLALLEKRPFGPIPDLGAPDGMLTLFGLSINVLPILMTVINLISSSIYTKGAPLKSRIQLYVMALVFLVFLYDSPAGLTMYWTLNNLFSLVKNLVVRNESTKKAMRILCGAAGFAVLVLTGLKVHSPKLRFLGIGLALLLQLPWLFHLLKARGVFRKAAFLEKAPHPGMFFLSASLMALLTGLLIPSSVVFASPAEFMSPDLVLNPTWYVVSSLLYACGTFIVWLGIFYLLGSREMKKVMEVLSFVAAGCLIVNYMALKPNFGTMNASLQYDVLPVFTLQQKLLNLGLLALVGAFLAFVFIRKEALVRAVCLAGAVAMAFMGTLNLVRAQGEIKESARVLTAAQTSPVQIPLSRTQPNVVVMMLDRAISSYLPVMFYEKPELKAKYDGFVYYPNTVSHGGHTNFGAPGLFGGYEYTPREMNARPDMELKDKHNEALQVLPTLFSRQNYTVTLIDLPYCGTYKWIPDFSLFDTLPNTHCFIADGRYNPENSADTQKALRMRNFFCYAVCETLPQIIHGPLYNAGLYNRAMILPDVQVQDSPSTARGIKNEFLKAYHVMKNLSSFTHPEDEDHGTFLMMSSDLPHRTTLLSEPDYVPADFIDNTAYDLKHADRFSAGERKLNATTTDQMMHYDVDMCAMMLVGDWLDTLRELGVYDNTRIILASDHGYNLGMIDSLIFPDGEDAMMYNPLLLFKDFGATGEVRIDSSFMTNADVPSLALSSVVPDPVNPFTGKPIDSASSKQEKQYVTMSHDWDTDTNNGNVFHPAKWYTVQTDLFDPANWADAGVQ